MVYNNDSNFSAKILADSVGPIFNIRLTTMEVKFPRFILAEFNTHRMLSRNFASTRAIPTKKLIEQVMTSPYIPEFGKNKPGMSSTELLSPEDQEYSEYLWLKGRDHAVETAQELMRKDAHKQFVGRLLEPYLWTTGIVSATDWANFFALRTHKDAQPEFQKLANLMLDVYKKSTPKEVPYDSWHLPLVFDEDRKQFNLEQLIQISVGRCARVSYLTHDGKRDPQEDIKLHDKLLFNQPVHASPGEHAAQATFSKDYCGNFKGWRQYRKLLPNENVETL